MPPNANHPPTPKSTPRPKSFSTNPALFAFTWAIALVASPFILIFLSSLYIYRSLIRVLATNFANLSSPLIPHDCIFAVDSYHTRPYASNLTVLELRSRLDITSLRSIFKSRVLDDPTFSKLLCIPVEYLGYWFWKNLDTKLDIHDSVKVYYDSELEHGVTKSEDECLREIVEMPYKSELFNVLLLHFGNRSIVVIRIHHTVCDGYSFNRLVDKFVGLQSKYLVRDKKKMEGGVMGMVKDGIKEFKKMAYLIAHLPLHVSTLYRESLTHTPNFYTLPKTSTSGTVRRTVLPLSQIKHIRATANSHFASIGMSLMTGALQKFYDSNPHPPHLRPDRLAIMHSLPKPNHPINSGKPEMTNCWNVGLFKIPFTRDSVSRMMGSEDDFNDYMGLQFDNVLDIHIPIVSLIPCFIVKWFFSINFGTSCGFTSVPGLFDKVAYIGGGGVDSGDGGRGGGDVEVSHMWKVFGLQWRQSAVAVAMYTYRGEASVSLYANKDIIPDDRSMDRLLELFHEEFNELVAYTNSHDKLPQIITNATPKPTVKPPQSNLFDTQKSNIIDTKFLDACFRSNKLA